MTVAEGSTVVRVLNLTSSCFPLLKVGTSPTDALRLILSRVTDGRTENGQPAPVFNFASFPPLP